MALISLTIQSPRLKTNHYAETETGTGKHALFSVHVTNSRPGDRSQTNSALYTLADLFKRTPSRLLLESIQASVPLSRCVIVVLLQSAL